MKKFKIVGIIIVTIITFLSFYYLVWAELRLDSTRLVRFENLSLTFQKYGQIELENIGFIVTTDKRQMSGAAAEMLISRINQAIKQKGYAVVGFPTGRTPELIYELLRTQYKEVVEWDKVIAFQLDEYIGLSPDDTRSFHYKLKNLLFEPLGIENFHLINGDAEDINTEIDRYESVIKSLIDSFGIDVILYGIGTNGHIMFNEPGFSSDRLVDKSMLSIETRERNSYEFDGEPENVPPEAITLTTKILPYVKDNILIASGSHKNDALARTVFDKDTPAANLLNHLQTTFVVDQKAAQGELVERLKEKLRKELKAKLGGVNLKVFASDLDFTLSPIGEKLRDSVINKVIELARQGIHIAIISGAKYERIKEQFIDYLPFDFPWQYLHIYGHVGAVGYGFDTEGNRITYYEVKMFPEQIEALSKVVEEFKERFPTEFVKYEVRDQIKGTIYLTQRLRTKEIYEVYLNFLEDRLHGTGLIINGSGHFGTIDISRADKSYAMKSLKDRLGLEFENIIYVGDAFSGKFANDLPTIIDGVQIFNVGSIDEVPDEVYSIGIRGDLGSEVLLEVIFEI